MDWLQRSELLYGKNTIENFKKKHVLVVGVGGVGGFAAEFLCRSGIGEMTIVDADTVSETNRNRQIAAMSSTIGKIKVDVIGDRLLDINPELKLHKVNEFLRDERTVELMTQNRYDYIVDAIDSLSPKVFLIYHALRNGQPLVSVMGAGGKQDPSLIQVADIKKTHKCKLAHSVRKRLHKLGITEGFKAVFSPEEVPAEAIVIEADNNEQNKLSTVGTASYMPAMFGAWAASVVIRDLAATTNNSLHG
ncbi:MAG: tRNA threonylcarbamoyladenosine dehydratase [Bacteroidales bacterium]|nr:tRNA threonylcarbamoyladenosine dehydratase [Bacteroidales bacterium]